MQRPRVAVSSISDCSDVVSVYVSADDFRAKRRVLPFDEGTLDVVLDRVDF